MAEQVKTGRTLMDILEGASQRARQARIEEAVKSPELAKAVRAKKAADQAAEDAKVAMLAFKDAIEDYIKKVDPDAKIKRGWEDMSIQSSKIKDIEKELKDVDIYTFRTGKTLNIAHG